MNLIRAALRKPITILVLVASLFFFGINAVRTIKIDIFPNLNLPVIYISQPFGGYTPNQMESFFGKQYVNLLLYVSGVKSIETKNIQSLTLIKLSFYEGTNMAQAAAEVATYSNRALALFPPGSQPPFILRFDASTLPVGQLVLSSPKRTNNELQDLANVYVRSGFTAIPGLVAPAPFGGNSRTIVIKADPALMRSHNLTPDQLVAALRINNQATPAGNVRVGDLNYFTPANTTIRNIEDFGNIPLYTGTVQNLTLKDVATITDGADITQGYVLVNGKRSVYMPITKSADASTWEVVQKSESGPAPFPVAVARRCETDLHLRPVRIRNQFCGEPDGGRRDWGYSDGADGTAVSGRCPGGTHRDYHHPYLYYFRRVVSVLIWPDHQHHDPERAGPGDWDSGG